MGRKCILLENSFYWRKEMKKKICFFLCIICIFSNIACKATSDFSVDEISEFSELVKDLYIIDFTFGKKYAKDPSQLKLFKVNNNASDIEELFFSISKFPLVKNRINSVEKRKGEIFIKFKTMPSGWCKGIVYMVKEDKYLRKRAKVFIELDENLFYFEGKS